MTKKKILIAAAVVLALIVVAFAGLFCLDKASRMWDRLMQQFTDIQTTTAQKIDELGADVRFMQGHYTFDYDWADKGTPLIAHAGGGIDGVNYTNSRDAFLHNYNLGYRVFEMDFSMSSEGLQLASHDENYWRSHNDVQPDTPYTHENFMKSRFMGKYEMMDFRDVLELMAEYPDMYLITDTKDNDEISVKYQFSQIVWQARQVDPSVLDRIIVQCYHEDMLNWVMDVYPFRSVMLTLYQIRWTPETVLDFCRRSGVRFITMPYASYTPEIGRMWDELGVTVAVHTLNDAELAQQYLRDGVDWIYTDFLNPADFAR